MYFKHCPFCKTSPKLGTHCLYNTRLWSHILFTLSLSLQSEADGRAMYASQLQSHVTQIQQLQTALANANAAAAAAQAQVTYGLKSSSWSHDMELLVTILSSFGNIWS